MRDDLEPIDDLADLEEGGGTAGGGFTAVTVCDCVRRAMSLFEGEAVGLGHGTADYWEEATFLVLRSLKLPFERLDSFWQAKLTEDELRLVMDNIAERIEARLPAPYVLNEAWLAGRPFYVDERVLIPRSYISELLGQDLAPWVRDPEQVRSVLDLCTGSGCLAVLAAESFPNARITASDISSDALEVAQINREEYGLQERIELVQSDLFENLAGRRFDVIISNPPYVTEAAMQALPDEYRHEPSLALAAGGDGMDIMRRMMPALAGHLTDEGVAVIEIGDGREAFEAIWPDLEVVWLDTADAQAMVFAVTARALAKLGA